MTRMRVVGECFFWYRLTRVFPDKFHRAVKRLCCVCVCTFHVVHMYNIVIYCIIVQDVMHNTFFVTDIPVSDETLSNSETCEGEQSSLLHNSINPSPNYLSVDTDNMPVTSSSVEQVATCSNPTTSESGVV